ncbi:MAG: tetratricopeptide repeat protein, partial [Candidatus Latescibacteria bacterium]|nr:tetratricopeptide repeat protein [Candidatus Latescibacterota bacterium]
RERTGEYALAVEAYSLVAARFADERRLSEEAYLRQAQLHYQRGDVAASIAVYQRALEAQQDDFGRARLQLLLANRYFETGNYLEAVREYSAYRDDYAAFAAQAGLPLEGVGLQIARAWFGRAEAEEVAPEERADLFRRAEAELRRTLEAFPNSTYEMDLRFNLGLALQRQSEEATTAQALDIFRELAASPQADGYRHSALFQCARILHGRSEYADAIQIYQSLDEELGDKPEADIARFEAAIAQRDASAWEEAVASFLLVRGEAEIHSRSRLEAGRLLLQQGRIQRALAVLREGAQTETDRVSQTLFNYLIATALSRTDDLDAALSRCGFVLCPPSLLRPGHGLFQTRPARRSHRRSRTRCCGFVSHCGFPAVGCGLYRRWAYRSGVAAIPAFTADGFLSAPTRRVLAGRQERYGQAIATCRELLALDFAEEERPLERTYYLREKGHWLMADAALRLEDYQAVADAATAGLAAYPSGFYAPDFLFLGGLAALQLDRYEEAVGRLQDSIARYPGHPNAAEAHYYLGYAYFNQTLFAQAVAAFEFVAVQAPDRNIAPDALFRLAECRYNLQQYDRAQAQYQQLIDRYSRSPLAEEALYNIGWCLMNSLAGDADQRNQEVQQAFAAYLENFPEGRYASIARYTLGELLYNQGDHQAAYDIFRQIEEQYPGTPA